MDNDPVRIFMKIKVNTIYLLLLIINFTLNEMFSEIQDNNWHKLQLTYYI